jgi:hypothetical protein
VHRGIVVLKQERAFFKLLTQSWITESSRMSLYTVVFRFPFTGTKEPEPWKTGPDHYSSYTKLYSWHYAFRQVAFSWHPPNPDSTVGLPEREVWFITPENGFHYAPVSANFTPHQPTLHMVIFIYLLFYQVNWLRTRSHLQQRPGE